ncbi:MAG: hypothetical protein WED04_09260 [Promethearchaeati archaeon SRVP18_Atabeyarchaeia-1]
MTPRTKLTLARARKREDHITWVDAVCLAVIFIFVVPSALQPALTGAGFGQRGTPPNTDSNTGRVSQHSSGCVGYARSSDWEEWSYGNGTRLRNI